MIEIKNRYTGNVIHTVDADTLRYANLHGANLHGADLCYADLCYADLCGANLHGANLHGANYYTSAILIARWHNLPDDLTVECMRYNASMVIDGEAYMTEWARGGDCPCKHQQRAINFTEERELWSPGPALTGAEMLVRLCKHAGVTLTNEEGK